MKYSFKVATIYFKKLTINKLLTHSPRQTAQIAKVWAQESMLEL